MAKLGIELDGSIHHNEEQVVYDQKRSEDLARMGVKVIRFWNDEVVSDIKGVLMKILEGLEENVKDEKSER